MSKYKLAYIDELAEDTREFQRFADDMFVVIPISPVGDLDVLLSSILENHVDAVVVDHNLIEYDTTHAINYEGNDVVNKILEVFNEFPVFVLTSYDEEAIDKNDDAKIVFEKRIMFASKNQPETFEAGIKFKKLIQKQIEKYKSRIVDWEKTLLELIEKGQKEKLDADEEAEVIRLDSLIEKALDKRIAVPDKIKKDIEEDKLGNLLKKVDELSQKLGKK